MIGSLRVYATKLDRELWVLRHNGMIPEDNVDVDSEEKEGDDSGATVANIHMGTNFRGE